MCRLWVYLVYRRPNSTVKRQLPFLPYFILGKYFATSVFAFSDPFTPRSDVCVVGVFVEITLALFFRQSDLDMWAALEAVQMKGYVYGLPGGLDALVSEGGGNLSVSLTSFH